MEHTNYHRRITEMTLSVSYKVKKIVSEPYAESKSEKLNEDLKKKRMRKVLVLSLLIVKLSMFFVTLC